MADNETNSDTQTGDDSIDQSQFNMWRAIFALAHADNNVTAEERSFMEEVISFLPFSHSQRVILFNDIGKNQDIKTLFAKIENMDDRCDFFRFADMMAWCDGHYDVQEQETVVELRKLHYKDMNFDNVMNVPVEFALSEEGEDDGAWLEQEVKPALEARGKKALLEKFVNRFQRSHELREGSVRDVRR